MSSSWTLLHAGRRKPPKRRISRIVWGIVVLLVSILLLPFVAWGIVEALAHGRLLHVVVFVIIGGLLVAGVVVPIVDWTRRPGADRCGMRPSPGLSHGDLRRKGSRSRSG